MTKTWKNLTKSWKILKVLESFGTKISKTWTPKFSFPNLVFPRLFFPRHGSLPFLFDVRPLFSNYYKFNTKSGREPCLGKKSLGKNKFGKENFGDHVLEIFVPKLSNTFKIFQLLVKFFQVLVKFFQVLVNFFLTL